MPSKSVLPARPLLYGLLCGVFAVLVRAALQPLVGDQLPFMIAFPMTMIVAVLYGWQAGAVCATLAALAVALPQIPPNLPAQVVPLEVGGFLVGSILMALFCGRVADRHDPAHEAPDRFDSSLSRWLRLVLWGALLVPVIAFVLVGWWGYERALRDAEGSVAHAADLAYRHAQRTFEVAEEVGRRADLAASGEDDDVRSREAAIHQRFADLTTGLPSVVNLNAWDAQGRPLVRSDAYPVRDDVRVDDREYFRQQRDSGTARGIGIGDVIEGRQTGRELANVTLRRTSPDGRFAGIVSVALAPGYFRDYYQSLAREQPNLASFAVVRLDGEVIARWPPASGAAAHRLASGNAVLRAIAGGARSGVVGLPEEGEREARIVGFRRLDTFPLYVVAGVGRQAMLASWVRFVGLLAAILLPTSAGLVYVSWVAIKKTQREAATAAELREQIDRRAAAERSMLQSQKLETLALVTGGVAHDFNNLLAIVNASLHVLKRRHPDLAQDKQVLAMGRAIQSGVRLTRQLLSFTRKQALKPEALELQTWLPATEGLIRSTLGANIGWQARVEPDTGGICVDVGELELALINLVVNARHAMPGGGTLDLHAANVEHPTDPARPMISIAVTDSGVGIAPEVLPKVFEPFFTTRAKGAGSGLGLSQVQGFCLQAGGNVRIESTPGRGTTVTMTLPATAPALTLEPEAAPRTASLGGQVLLVEDNEDVATTTELVLRSAGLDVVRRSNAAAALVCVESLPRMPDAVLSDIAMPGTMDGIALAFELRARHPSLPVLLTTGYTEHLQQAVAGGFRVLPKPVAPDELLAALSGVMPPPETPVPA